jgi:hypothetical protein
MIYKVLNLQTSLRAQLVFVQVMLAAMAEPDLATKPRKAKKAKTAAAAAAANADADAEVCAQQGSPGHTES